jgi:hypothetical protein
MPDPIDHTKQRGTIESVLRKIPGFRGYLEKEYRRDADRLQREWLADRLQRSKPAIDAFVMSLTDAGQLDALPLCDRLRARLDKLIGRIRGAMQGYSGFFDLVQVDEALLDRVYQFDVSLMDDVETAAESVEKLSAQVAQPPAAQVQAVMTRLQELDKHWDLRTDMLRGLE